MEYKVFSESPGGKILNQLDYMDLCTAICCKMTSSDIFKETVVLEDEGVLHK